jgi:LysM repeat protein
VDIPLKKLSKGALPGQSSGVVTIPFVLISSPQKKVEQQSTTYTIEKGDTLSILIAKKFGGRYGSKTYNQGLALFKAINPHIDDIHRIYAGQQIYLPDPSIREKSWYAALFNEQGDLVEQFWEDNQDRKETSEQESAEKEAALPQLAAVDPPQLIEPAPEKEAQEEKKHAGDAAKVLDGRYLDKGTLYLPRGKQKDFEIDLSRYPMIDFGYGDKAVLTTQDEVMDVALPLVQSYWDNIKIVKVPEKASSGEILQSILTAFSEKASMDRLAFGDTGVFIQVKGQWIRSRPSPDGQSLQHACITLIESDAQRTHEAIVRYLEQNDIIISDIALSSESPPPPSGNAIPRGESNRIDYSSPNDFIAAFSRILDFSYAPDTPITFPYAGVQVEAKSNLLSFGNGRQVLVDFGELYGDAEKAIKATGLDIVTLPQSADAFEIIRRLMETAAVDHTAFPIFHGAERPDEFNTTIRVDGILIPRKEGEDQLFVKNQPPDLIGSFILSKGIQMVVIKEIDS